MKTYSPKPHDIERRWYVIDASGAVLGRLASEVAKVLRGKHKPIFAPHADTGDHVIVVNARGVRLTGAKGDEKVFYRHSGYPGGLRRIGYARLMAERPSLAVERAIRGMLPKNRLGRQMIKKLAVYEGPTHPHKAQRPVALELGRLPRWEGLPKPKPAAAPPPAARGDGRRTRGAGRAKAATARAGREGDAGASRRPTRAKAPSKARTQAGGRRAPAPGTGEARPRRRTAGAQGRRSAVQRTGASAGTEKKPGRTRRRKTTKES